MPKMKLDLEKAFIIIFFAIFFFIGPGILFEHKVKHDFPYAYLASDTFQHQTRAEAIKDAGNFRYEANYISKGLDNVVGRYPPVLYHIAVMYSYASGLEVYDSIYLVIFLFSGFAVLILYFMIRDFNRNIAMLSLPLSLLIFSKASMIGFVWGHWPSMLGQFFLIALFWGFAKFEIEKSYILIGIFLSSLIMSHTANLVFALFFILIFALVRLFLKKLDWTSIKTMLLTGIMTFILTAYYLVIFRNTWFISQAYTFSVSPIWQGNPGFYIFDFKIILLFILTGVVFSIMTFKNKPNAAAIASFSMLLLGFGNYIGFDFRAFQIRFLWPAYLSFFFGFAIYQILSFFIKNWSSIYSTIFGLLLIFVFVGIVNLPYVLQYDKFSTSGIMDKFHWEALNWIAHNTQQNAKIYFFYGDIYSQDALLRNSKRVHYQVDNDDFVASVKERKVRRGYISEIPGDNGGSLVYRRSFFSFGDYGKDKGDDYFFGKKDICSFDYFVFDKASMQKVLAEYNLLIASQMLNKSAQIAFQNNFVVILKNSKVGGDCIAERSF